MKLNPRALVCAMLCSLLWILSHGSLCCQETPPAPSPPATGDTRALSPEERAAFEPTAADVARIASPSANRYEGLRVRDIQFRGASAAEPARLLSILPLQINEPLDKKKLQQSIQALYQTGKFADVKVEAQRTPGAEVSLVFVAKENYFVGAISIDGTPKAPPTYNQLVTSTKLQLGELFTQEKLDHAVARMRRTLEDNGYFRADIAPELVRHSETQQVDIIFRLQAGKVARVGDVAVRGNPGYSSEEIRKIEKLKKGDRVSAPNVTRALQRLRNRYQKKGRLEAQVSLTDKIYHPEMNTVDYVFQIARGSTVDIHVEGAHIRKGLLKKYVPVYEENAVDDDLLNEGRRNLRDYFQTKGYFEVQIDFRQQTVDDHRHIIYDVNRGRKHKLVRVDIAGNRYFPEEEIRQRLKIQAAGWLLRYGLFSQSMLSRDVESIVTLYRNNGFLAISVKANAQDDYQGKEGDIRVLFQINEGPQTRVAKLHIEGNSAFSEEQIRAEMINGTEGQPFSDVNLATDRDTVLIAYFNHGFSNAQFEYFFKQISTDPSLMEVTYKITEGLQVFVDRVLVGGLNHTRPWVVTRELDIHDDEPLDQSAMFRSQSRLYDLGIFNEVDVAVQNPEGQAPSKNVLIQTAEGRRYTFNYGLGLEVQTGSTPGSNLPQGRTGVSPRVSFDMTRLNFLGRNHTITFKTRFGRLQQRGLISYQAPWLFNRPNWFLTFTSFYDSTRDVRTFTAHRLEGSIQAEQRLGNYISACITCLLYRFTYRRVQLDPNTLAIDPNLIPLLSKPVRVGIPGFTFIRDRRDDPANSHRGNYNTLDMGVSAGIFGSEASFSRTLFSNSTYHELKGRKWIVARSTRVGVEDPIGKPNIIPLPERFYAGGGNSHRGFAINQAGPRDLQTGFPLGGEALFINQTELRFEPLRLPFIGDNLSPVLFHDMGNIFSSAGQIFPSFVRFAQPSRSQCETVPATTCSFNYMSHAVGLGARYATPIGPVRVDFGYNLNPPTFPVNRENRFETLKHFNVYFSIGQTF